jgi:CubicO group peptidase (beta-lactamase class C family)
VRASPLLTRRQTILLPAAAIALLATPVKATTTPVAGDLEDQLDAVISEYVDVGTFRGAVLVNRSGETVLRKAYGTANEISSTPNTPETAYQIASLTKAFTALACVQLDGEGRLSLDDPITRYLPEVTHAELNSVAVTIRHLLSHTSGVPDFLDFYDVNNPLSYPRTFNKLLGDIIVHDLLFTPGSEFAYSNSGYIYAGLIIERVSGATYETYLKEHIFKPAGMTESYIVDPPDPAPPAAIGYGMVNDQLVGVSAFGRVDLVWSAGGITSTVDDLLRWHEALLTEDLASRAAIEAMYQPILDSYGLGWESETIAGRHAVDHEGHTIGFDSNLTRFLEDDAVIIVLSNLQDAPEAEITERLADVLFGLTL